MRLHVLILACALFPQNADAKQKRVSGGASQMEPSDFFACVNAAVNGRTDEVCATRGESNDCIGMRLAFEYTLQETRCDKAAHGRCIIFGHKQNSQPQWVSVASGHVANFMGCIRHRYGGDASSGAKEALTDKSLLEFLRRLDDGGGRWGLANGEILIRTLQGHRLSTILASSWEAKDMPTDQFALIKQGADVPAPNDDYDESLEEKTKNPAQRGTSLVYAWSHAYGSAPDPANFDPADWPNDSPIKTPKPAPARPQALPEVSAEVADTIAPRRLASTTKPRTARTGVVEREYRENPYTLGLDLTLFDRVSSTYRRHSPSLESIDLFLKAPKAGYRDVRDEIHRGEAIEL